MSNISSPQDKWEDFVEVKAQQFVNFLRLPTGPKGQLTPTCLGTNRSSPATGSGLLRKKKIQKRLRKRAIFDGPSNSESIYSCWVDWTHLARRSGQSGLKAVIPRMPLAASGLGRVVLTQIHKFHPPNIKHPSRNQALVGGFHMIGTI